MSTSSLSGRVQRAGGGRALSLGAWGAGRGRGLAAPSPMDSPGSQGRRVAGGRPRRSRPKPDGCRQRAARAGRWRTGWSSGRVGRLETDQRTRARAGPGRRRWPRRAKDTGGLGSASGMHRTGRGPGRAEKESREGRRTAVPRRSAEKKSREPSGRRRRPADRGQGTDWSRAAR